MNEEIESRLAAIEKRLSILEDGQGKSGETAAETIELDLTLPEADIGGLHFNEQKVHAVFEWKDDGAYYSRDILFLSARNIEDNNSRDILTEYLNSVNVKNAFITALGREVDIFLPEENRGIKKYNGVPCWYWLEGKESGSAANFAIVNGYGIANCLGASVVGGCAPAFRIEYGR